MLRTVAISSFLFAGAVSLAHADVFRWVDEHGGVHYSDQWVPGSQVIKSVKPRPSGASDVAPRQAAVAPKPSPVPATDAGQQSAAKAVKQDMAKAREQQCKDAKDRYNKAIEARRIYKAAPNGKKDVDGTEERQYLSDDEADAYRVKARQEVDDFCGKSAK
jgi:hypothetical protein